MPFTNRIRLPFYLSKPQYPVDEEIYIKANSRRVVQKSIISKEMEAKTDYLPALLHERLAVALRHDIVSVEGQNYSGDIRINGAYTIDWVDFLDFPVAPANFKAFDDGFAARLTRCEICNDVTELSLQPDVFPGILEEGETYNINVSTNDGICCANPIFSIDSFDSNFIDSISIVAETGVVTMTLKTPLNSAANITLFTYKVICGGEEETATVSGTIEGSGSALCPAPSNLVLTEVDPASVPYEINANWDASIPAPADGYRWTLHSYSGATEVLISFGTTTATEVNINSLDCGVTYRFRVTAVCDAELPDESATLVADITISCPAPGENMYLVNETGQTVDIESDGTPYSFPPPFGGNVVIYPLTNFTNKSGITLKFRFLSSMPNTLITEQILADDASYVFPADVSNYNYVRVTIP